MWSRIHADLGLLPSELTHAMVAAGVAQRVRENVDLDWKQALPPSDVNKRKEFAKDIAAMANSRGGLIVFGVTEANEEATGFLPVVNAGARASAPAAVCGAMDPPAGRRDHD